MVSLIRLSLRRPVTVCAVYLLTALLAAVALLRLPVSLLPDLRFPALAIWTALPEASPERVERLVTEPVEEAIAGIVGLESVTSRSQLGGSLILLRFDWATNVDLALLEVREQLDRLGAIMPRDAKSPVVLRFDPSERPLMVVGLRGVSIDVGAGQDGAAPHDLGKLKELGTEVLARRLEQLEGVARVRVFGGYQRQVQIIADTGRLARAGLGIEDVAGAVRGADVRLAGGTVKDGSLRYAVEVTGELGSLEEIAATVLRRTPESVLRLRDMAVVREGVADRRGLVRFDRAETLLLSIERRADANTVRTAQRVREALVDLQAQFPDVRLDVLVDQSSFIEEAISGVLWAVVSGGLLAIVALLLFVRRAGSILALAIAIPLSLLVTLVLFDLFGVGFNLLSLAGLALGIGMLVDNAIVVVENIARLRATGMPPGEAAALGAGEVVPAIVASTLTTIAVFLPLTFVEGLAGRLFRDQSFAIVCSLLASLVVAVTAVPLLTTRIRTQGGSPDGWKGPWIDRYERAVAWCLRHRWTTVALTVVYLVCTLALGWSLPRQVVPPTEQNRFLVDIELPPHADLEAVSDRAAAIEERLLGTPGIRHVLSDLGERDEARLELDPRPAYAGTLTVFLGDGPSADPIVGDLQRSLARELGGGEARVTVRPVRTRLEELLVGGDEDLFIDLRASRRRDADAVADRLLKRLADAPAVVNAAKVSATRVSAYRLSLDRLELARTGLEPAALGEHIEASARGVEVARFREVAGDTPVVVRAPAESLEGLLGSRVSTPEGPYRLERFLDVERVSLPASLVRTDQQSVVRVTADIGPGHDLRDALRAIEAEWRDLLPEQVTARIGGANDAFLSSLRGVGLSLLLSVFLVYLILAAQLESLLQPLVILVTVPLAIGGVAISLAVTGQTLNMMSLTGCVILAGIVVNDAIVKVDFINRRREEGVELGQAICQAGRQRLRPILMTTFTTVLGLAPMALGLGAAAELRRPLAIAIAGGILTASLLTLVVVPVLYRLVVAPGKRRHPLP